MQAQQLFTTSSVMRGLQELWDKKSVPLLRTSPPSPTTSRFSSVHLVSVDALQGVELPLSPADFEQLIRSECQRARETLRDK